MAVIRDIIPAFELFQPPSVGDALRLIAKHRDDYWVVAGGLDTMDWLKDRLRKPRHVIDLSQVKELTGVKEVDGALEIGAMTTLTDVVHHPLIRDRFGLLSSAAERVASPQIRNQATIGGNVSQDTRCWYYRGGWECYRAGGNICYADTPTAINREHAIMNADRCVAVSPSDTAPALIALQADMVVRNGDGERVIAAEDYFVGPSIDITRMTVLRPGDLLTSIRLPETWRGADFYFEKIADRNVWDFPLVNIAAATVMSKDTIGRMRIAVNGVAATPLRLQAVEHLVQGKRRDESTATAAGELAIAGAVALQHNAYKVTLLRNLVKRAVRGVENTWIS
jgi:xanthine dehydrogenase YagS FAD-binding subunit